MTRFSLSLIVCTLPLQVSCALFCSERSSNPKGDLGADAAAIRSLLVPADRAFAAGDVNAIVDNYDRDAVLLAPEGAAIVGRDEIRAWYAAMLAAFAGAHEMHSEEVVVFGNWAFDRGTVKGSIRSKPDGSSYPIDNKYVYLLRRQLDGQWKYARVIWNTNLHRKIEAGSETAAERR